MSGPSSWLNQLSAQISLPVDLIKTLLLMLLSIPLSYILRFIRQSFVRYSYSLIIGVLYLVFLLHQWALFVFLVAIVPLALCRLIKRNQHAICIVVSTAFLLFIHVYRFMYDYMSWKIDCSVSVMYLVTKVIYYGSFLQQHKRHTSSFKYFSYCFFFPSVLIGPTFSYPLFENFIQAKNGYENPPIRTNALLKQTTKAVIFSGLTAYFVPIFHQYWILQNERWLSLHPFLQFLLLAFVGFCYRIKFYSAWAITQISIDQSGLSWNEKNQDFSSVRCGSPRFQTEVNPRNKTNYWNTSVQVWLKEMIYDKMLKYKSNLLATLVTFIYSAFWHGVYLTYYVAFIQWAVIIVISKWAYKMSLAYPKLSDNPIAKWGAFVIGTVLLNYVGMFIVVLNWAQAMQSRRNMYFIGHILLAILLFLSLAIKPRSVRPKNHIKESRGAEKHNQNSIKATKTEEKKVQ